MNERQKAIWDSGLDRACSHLAFAFQEHTEGTFRIMRWNQGLPLPPCCVTGGPKTTRTSKYSWGSLCSRVPPHECCQPLRASSDLSRGVGLSHYFLTVCSTLSEELLLDPGVDVADDLKDLVRGHHLPLNSTAASARVPTTVRPVRMLVMVCRNCQRTLPKRATRIVIVSMHE